MGMHCTSTYSACITDSPWIVPVCPDKTKSRAGRYSQGCEFDMDIQSRCGCSFTRRARPRPFLSNPKRPTKHTFQLVHTPKGKSAGVRRCLHEELTSEHSTCKSRHAASECFPGLVCKSRPCARSQTSAMSAWCCCDSLTVELGLQALDNRLEQGPVGKKRSCQLNHVLQHENVDLKAG